MFLRIRILVQYLCLCGCTCITIIWRAGPVKKLQNLETAMMMISVAVEEWAEAARCIICLAMIGRVSLTMPLAALTLSVSLQIMILLLDSSSSFSKCILEELGAKLQFGFQNLGNVAREHICHSLVKYFSSRKIHTFVDVSFSSNFCPGCKMFAT